MGRLVVSTMVSLDGVMEAPERWAFEAFDEEQGRWALDELLAADALLLGRVTYEAFVEYWPSAIDDSGLAERMNAIPKYVASTRLDTVAWNSTLVRANVAGRVAELKREQDQDLLLLASAELMDTLMRRELIDEYRLRVVPVVVGRGKRLFAQDAPRTALRLVRTQTAPSGVVVLTLQPRGPEQRE